MSDRDELRETLETAGYHLGRFASKEGLKAVLRLHSKVFQTKGINVAQLPDAELRRWLKEARQRVGPATNHTRAIYQRRLLEVLAEETIDYESDIDEPVLKPADDEPRLNPTYERKVYYPNIPARKKNEEPTVVRRADAPLDDALLTKSKATMRKLYGDLDAEPPRRTEPLVKKSEGGAFFIYVGIALAVAAVTFYFFL